MGLRDSGMMQWPNPFLATKRSAEALLEYSAEALMGWYEPDSTWWLADVEQQVYSNRCRWHMAPGGSAERLKIYQDSLDLISTACGYDKQTGLKRISYDYECAKFCAVPQWGKDRYQYNDGYGLNNHITMATDRPRVEAFQRALDRAANGRHVLDLGCGPFCLLSRFALQAGALSVACVEQNPRAVKHAINIFKGEAEYEPCKGLNSIGASLHDYDLVVHTQREGGPSVSVSVSAEKKPYRRTLHLFEGFSADVSLHGMYDLVVHEILGHIASSEGVAHAITDLRNRNLLAKSCVFVPRKATTFFAPIEQINLTCLERILANLSSVYGGGLQRLGKYQVDRFPHHMSLAAPGIFEDLEFTENMRMHQHAIVEFITERSGIFDGFHFHMVVDMDGSRIINTLFDETSWSTTYIKLLEPGILLSKGSRIVCDTWVQLDRPAPLYSIAVFIGEYGNEQFVSTFSWSGCT